eukprot:2629117-Alexandrium_andersonii.AAC.1
MTPGQTQTSSPPSWCLLRWPGGLPCGACADARVRCGLIGETIACCHSALFLFRLGVGRQHRRCRNKPAVPARWPCN